MKKYLPILITLVATLGTVLSTSAQAFWSHHPQIVAVIAGVWASVKWLLPSPLQEQK